MMMKTMRVSATAFYVVVLLLLSSVARDATGFMLEKRATQYQSINTRTSTSSRRVIGGRRDNAAIDRRIRLLEHSRYTRRLHAVVVNGGEAMSGGDDDATTATTTTNFPHEYVARTTRDDFDILKRTVTDQHQPLIYLDSAATSQKPKQVVDAVSAYYEQTNSNVHRGAHTLSREATAQYEAARDKVANLINANSRSEIIFTSGATESINLVAQTYGRANLGVGDEIILSVAEHHSNMVPWQILAEEKGFTIKFIRLCPDTGGFDLVDQMESLITSKTKFVAFPHVSNVLAVINPVKDMVTMIRQRAHPEVKILLDACQSVPHMVVDVQDLGVDFIAASGHKMCAPTGIGFLWGKLDLLNTMPPWKGGGEMIDQVTLEGSTWLPAPSRFEAGTPPIAQAIGLGAAIDYLQKIGMDNVEAYEHELSAYLYEQLVQVPGITILGPHDPTKRAALCAFVHDTVHPSDLSSFLDIDGVAIRAGHHCCQPLHNELGYSHSARASLYFYNTKEDIDAFIVSLRNTLKFFTGLEQGGTATADGGAADGSSGNGSTDEEDEFVPFI